MAKKGVCHPVSYQPAPLCEAEVWTLHRAAAGGLSGFSLVSIPALNGQDTLTTYTNLLKNQLRSKSFKRILTLNLTLPYSVNSWDYNIEKLPIKNSIMHTKVQLHWAIKG